MSSSTSTTTTTSDALIPNLPNDIATTILLSIPLPHHRRLKLTCRSWHAFLSSPSLLSLRRLHRRRRGLLCVFPNDPSLSHPYLLEPSTLSWMPLPLVPCSPYLYNLTNFVPVALGGCLYVVGGSYFDARAFPLEQPSPSRMVFRMDLAAVPLAWVRVTDMYSARGSLACAAVEGPLLMNPAGTSESKGAQSSDGSFKNGAIVVAGGGSRHTLFPSVGSRSRVAEIFDVGTGKWKEMEPLPNCRAGCTGWIMDGEEEQEFWVMGGYGGYRTVSGVFPVDVYCRDGAVLGMKSGKWREIGNMWEDGERKKLGPVAVLHGEDEEVQGIFMLDQVNIFRYNVVSNLWTKEATLPRKSVDNESRGFVAIDGELHVLTSEPLLLDHGESTTNRKSSKKNSALDIQVYHPRKKKWRSLSCAAPFKPPIDYNVTPVFCTMHI